MTEDFNRPDVRLGMEVEGRYRILRSLGQGGMGTVYEAEHLRLGKRVAIKCLHTHVVTDQKIIRRFQNEAIAVTRVGHANVVEALDMGTLPDGAPFVVYEMLHGMSLCEWIKEHRLTKRELLQLLSQLSSALEAVHSHSIIHRDIKPDNLFITEAEQSLRLKVLDFGVSQIAAASLQTSAGQLLGTPAFMAPEQVTASEVSAVTDLYSVGVTLYWLLSGKLPFEADSVAALALKIVTERPRLPDDVDAGFRDLVDALLEKDPSRRKPATATELRLWVEAERERSVVLDDWITPERGDTVSPVSVGAPTTPAASPSRDQVEALVPMTLVTPTRGEASAGRIPGRLTMLGVALSFGVAAAVGLSLSGTDEGSLAPVSTVTAPVIALPNPVDAGVADVPAVTAPTKRARATRPVTSRTQRTEPETNSMIVVPATVPAETNATPEAQAESVEIPPRGLKRVRF